MTDVVDIAVLVRGFVASLRRRKCKALVAWMAASRKFAINGRNISISTVQRYCRGRR